MVKNNIGPSTGNSLAFRFRPLGEHGEMIICYEGPVDITADQAIASQQPKATKLARDHAEAEMLIVASLTEAGPAAISELVSRLSMGRDRIKSALRRLTATNTVVGRKGRRGGNDTTIYDVPADDSDESGSDSKNGSK